MVDPEDCDDDDVTWLGEVLTRHLAETASAVAGRILAGWPRAATRFVKVMPRDYKRVLEAMRAAEAAGTPAEDAIMAAAKGKAPRLPRIRRGAAGPAAGAGAPAGLEGGLRAVPAGPLADSGRPV